MVYTIGDLTDIPTAGLSPADTADFKVSGRAQFDLETPHHDHKDSTSTDATRSADDDPARSSRGAAMDKLFAPKFGGKRLKNPETLDTLNRPLVSIITVVLNGAKELESSIRSVIHSHVKNVEYIIIDGGSTDGTLAVLDEYEDSIDYWLSEPDRGIYDALNKAIAAARGRWVCASWARTTLCRARLHWLQST